MPVVQQTGNCLFVRVEPGRATVRVVLPRVSEPEAPKDALSALDSGDARLSSAIDRARRIIGKPIALVLQGESGAGKEFFAKAFHDSGPRRAKPFIALNCATLPESLIEAEPVSYTHLDVYKRQVSSGLPCLMAFTRSRQRSMNLS